MVKLSIKDIEELIREVKNPSDPILLQCLSDDRKGVQRLAEKWQKAFDVEQSLKNKWLEMNEYENKLRKEGFSYIAGIDEVGRGPLAGPVVAAAVILKDDCYLPGLNDSKKIPEKKRDEFYEKIMKNCVSFGIGIVSNVEIDEINIYESTKKAMLSAVQNLNPVPDFLLIDAMKLDAPFPQESIIKGDARSVSISAASIVAKVTRDRMMADYAKQYPDFNFEKNMGYGTPEHLSALMKSGPTPIHRYSFAPVKDYVK
ncbi:ribonuclease HII [Peribacillus alkalitolerans]|uniref:ribonuclease HII n=1 Tax=Peribacillus alkalitolerans TaxID=1550385 RepID=UPI0013D53BDD|nr:ribonuclease HII [Peribacillus alkalitolerans]